jgi:hypothetical protein
MAVMQQSCIQHELAQRNSSYIGFLFNSFYPFIHGLSRLALLNEKTKNLGSAPEERSPGF